MTLMNILAAEPITTTKVSLEFIPKMATVTAIANSKLLLAAVNESVTVSEYLNFRIYDIINETVNIMRK